MIKRSVKKAFTLIEILIVVVILGILAAIVIPQFTRASEDAQVGNVVTQLQTIRSQVELYRVRNNGQIPDLTAANWGGLITQPGDAVQYLRSAPINPRTGTSTVAEGDAATAAATVVVRGNDGWLYDPATGQIWANGFVENPAAGQTQGWATAGN